VPKRSPSSLAVACLASADARPEAEETPPPVGERRSPSAVVMIGVGCPPGSRTAPSVPFFSGYAVRHGVTRMSHGGSTCVGDPVPPGESASRKTPPEEGHGALPCPVSMIERSSRDAPNHGVPPYGRRARIWRKEGPHTPE
jgi:hypothetical protein